MLKNDKGDCFFFLTKEVLASYFSFQVFVSHSDSGLFFSFFFSFLWLFPTSFLTAKSLMIKHKISHYMHKMTGWGCSKRPQKCAHSSLRFVRVIPSIQACTELGLQSDALYFRESGLARDVKFLYKCFQNPQAMFLLCCFLRSIRESHMQFHKTDLIALYSRLGLLELLS